MRNNESKIRLFIIKYRFYKPVIQTHNNLHKKNQLLGLALLNIDLIFAPAFEKTMIR